ncbi:hypothetical protein MHYP_G00215660 [Metynnis hypsauchen]
MHINTELPSRQVLTFRVTTRGEDGTRRSEEARLTPETRTLRSGLSRPGDTGNGRVTSVWLTMLSPLRRRRQQDEDVVVLQNLILINRDSECTKCDKRRATVELRQIAFIKSSANKLA